MAIQREAVETLGDRHDDAAAMTALERIAREHDREEVQAEAIETIADLFGTAAASADPGAGPLGPERADPAGGPRFDRRGRGEDQRRASCSTARSRPSSARSSTIPIGASGSTRSTRSTSCRTSARFACCATSSRAIRMPAFAGKPRSTCASDNSRQCAAYQKQHDCVEIPTSIRSAIAGAGVKRVATSRLCIGNTIASRETVTPRTVGRMP